MIRVAITGAGSDEGGELLRILSMHPDVVIGDAREPELAGRPVTSRHHGLIGETDCAFTDGFDVRKTDVAFVCEGSMDAGVFYRLRMERPDMKIILMGDLEGVDDERECIVYGLPEINRKLLVRGATAAVVPTPFASMALVALYPLALAGALKGDIAIDIKAPAAVIAENDPSEAAAETAKWLGNAHTGFSGDVSVTATESNTRRSALMHIDAGCNIPAQELQGLYGIYDDHRFAFAVTTPVGVSEVAGTNKCVVTVNKGGAGRAVLAAAADCRMRGAAGEAVHIMNLMCGLHERTGLALKATDYLPVD